jgi:tetratricopeptide (TPR) repeat protein
MELGQLAERYSELDPRVELLALSVDGLADERASETEARGLVERLRLPFATGWATPEFVGKFELIEQHMFEPIRPVSIPTSVLINRRGELAAVYRGPVDVDQLWADLAHLDDDMPSRRQRSLPLPGRWAASPAPLRLLPIAWDLLDRGWLDDGLQYIQQHDDTLASDPEYAKLLALTGYLLLERGDVERAAEQYRASIAQDPRTIVAHLNLAAALVRLNRYADAIAQYRTALQYGPRDVRIYNGLAWLLATAEDPAVRDGTEAVKLAERAAAATEYRHGLVLETLAAAQARAGRFADAVATSQRAARLARDTADQEASRRIDERLRLYRAGQPFHEVIPREPRNEESKP